MNVQYALLASNVSVFFRNQTFCYDAYYVIIDSFVEASFIPMYIL